MKKIDPLDYAKNLKLFFKVNIEAAFHKIIQKQFGSLFFGMI
jgi:hypothetical protein